MKKPEINFDVALQYEGTQFPMAEALVRGREDFLADRCSKKFRISKCPYKNEDLREAWMQGYSTEAIEWAHATEGVR